MRGWQLETSRKFSSRDNRLGCAWVSHIVNRRSEVGLNIVFTQNFGDAFGNTRAWHHEESGGLCLVMSIDYIAREVRYTSVITHNRLRLPFNFPWIRSRPGCFISKQKQRLLCRTLFANRDFRRISIKRQLLVDPGDSTAQRAHFDPL